MGIDIYTLACVKQTTSGNLLPRTGSSDGAIMAQMAEMGEQQGGLGGRSKREEIYVYI